MRFTLLTLLILIPAIHAEHFTGDGSFQRTYGTQLESITINLTGDAAVNSSLYLDGELIWQHRAYHSNRTLVISDITAAASRSGTFYFFNASTGEISNKTHYGSVDGHRFIDGDQGEGVLGISTQDGHDPQAIIMQANQTIRAFLPQISTVGATAGYYVAEGGSTYYCNSAHTNLFYSDCNLTPQEAMSPGHLARSAQEELNSTETVLHDIKSHINSRVPATFTFNVTLASGNLTVNITSIEASEPANITAAMNGSSYDIRIYPNLALENVSYLYGEMPDVHIIPAVADDDGLAHTLHQSERLSIFNALDQHWDNLTGGLHPLNVTLYNTTEINYRLGESEAAFSTAVSDMIEAANLSYPAIVMILDVHDYFPDADCTCQAYSPPGTYGMIAQIRLNGFSENTTKAQMENDTDILMNLALHELAHAFIFYPGHEHFYNQHPASYTDLPSFSTRSPDESPTGTEGYFEFYSILNQVSIFTAGADLGLSPLDKMLLGTLSPEISYNYTFYEGTVTDQGNHYQETLSPGYTESANSHFENSLDHDWWDARNLSDRIYMGTQTEFQAEKRDTALWVYAKDSAFNHFRVFAGNSILEHQSSLKAIQLSPHAGYEGISAELGCFAPHAENLSIYTDWGIWSVNGTALGSNITFTFNPDNGTYTWACEACWDDGCRVSENRTISIIEDVMLYPPEGFVTHERDVNFSCTTSLLFGSWTQSNYTIDSWLEIYLGYGRYNWWCSDGNSRGLVISPPADTDVDGDIITPEMEDYVDGWFSGNVQMMPVVDALEYWQD